MSQQQIQPTNLPIYLQNYTVDILDGKKEPKKMGDVFYSTVGAIPSNVPRARVWQMNLTGTLRPTSEKYTILYDFKKVDYQNKNIRFENIVSGTFNVCGQVLDASKVIGKNYTFSDEESTLTFTIKIPKLGFRLKKESLFSFNLTIDDLSSTTSCPTDPACFGDDYQPITYDKAVPLSSSEGGFQLPTAGKIFAAIEIAKLTVLGLLIKYERNSNELALVSATVDLCDNSDGTRECVTAVILEGPSGNTPITIAPGGNKDITVSFTYNGTPYTFHVGNGSYDGTNFTLNEPASG